MFDLDGTVIDSSRGVFNAVRYALEKMRAPIPTDEELKAFVGPPLLYSFINFCGMSDGDAKRTVELYREYYSEKGIFELTVYDGICAALNNLRDAGFKTLLATSKPQPFAARIAERFGFSAQLDGIYGADFDGKRIDKNEVLEYALQDFGIDVNNAVMVGDRKYDILGAKRFGLKSIGVLYGFGDESELKKAGADKIVRTAEDIFGAIAEL